VDVDVYCLSFMTDDEHLQKGVSMAKLYLFLNGEGYAGSLLYGRPTRLDAFCLSNMPPILEVGHLVSSAGSVVIYPQKEQESDQVEGLKDLLALCGASEDEVGQNVLEGGAYLIINVSIAGTGKVKVSKIKKCPHCGK